MLDFKHYFTLGHRALKAPSPLGDELREHYWLDTAAMKQVLVCFMLAQLFAAIPLLPETLIAEGLAKTLIALVVVLASCGLGLVLIWFVQPFFERLGYLIVGAEVDYHQARRIMVASYLPNLSPWVIGIAFAVGITDLDAMPQALTVIGKIVFFVMSIAILIQSLRLRKHMLDIAYWRVVLCFLGFPTLLVIIGLVIGGVLVGQDMVKGAETRRAVEHVRQAQERGEPVNPHDQELVDQYNAMQAKRAARSD